jgi:hypothetical protein
MTFKNYVKLKLNGRITILDPGVDIEKLAEYYEVEPCSS